MEMSHLEEMVAQKSEKAKNARLKKEEEMRAHEQVQDQGQELVDCYNAMLARYRKVFEVCQHVQEGYADTTHAFVLRKLNDPELGEVVITARIEGLEKEGTRCNFREATEFRTDFFMTPHGLLREQLGEEFFTKEPAIDRAAPTFGPRGEWTDNSVRNTGKLLEVMMTQCGTTLGEVEIALCDPELNPELAETARRFYPEQVLRAPV